MPPCLEVWERNFGDVLKVRSSSLHVKCSICVRYKLLIRRLARCSEARSQQLRLLERHRERQYKDRCVYWHARNISRTFAGLQAPSTVCLICDSMDQAKYSWPRDSCLAAKEFAKFIKPKLTVTAVISHGHDVFLGISLPGVSQDSSRTIDMLARCLERFRERGQDIRGAEILLQGDNGPKEIKNNPVVRYLAMLVSLGRVRRAVVRTLMTGHTHEDVDLLFSNLTKLLVQGGHQLHTPFQFQRVLQSYLGSGHVRPHERDSEVALVDQVHDWTLGQGVLNRL